MVPCHVSRMDVIALHKLIEDDASSGKTPVIVIAQAGINVILCSSCILVQFNFQRCVFGVMLLSTVRNSLTLDKKYVLNLHCYYQFTTHLTSELVITSLLARSVEMLHRTAHRTQGQGSVRLVSQVRYFNEPLSTYLEFTTLHLQCTLIYNFSQLTTDNFILILTNNSQISIYILL